MHLPPSDDRTAKARIRDEALRLFAEESPDAVTMRDIAAAAEVSPALLIRHFGSKDGLIDAVDNHVITSLDLLLTQITSRATTTGLGPSAVPSLLDGLATHLPPDSPIPRYLGRLLISGGSIGSALFARLYQMSNHAFQEMIAAGTATAGGDPQMRAALLLVNDLAVLILRSHLHEVLGVDPLSAEGAQRWVEQVFAIYNGGLASPVAVVDA